MKDCMYPDCQIRGEWLGTACEHSCDFESEQKWNARKGATAEERIRYWAWDGNPPPRSLWRRFLAWLAR